MSRRPKSDQELAETLRAWGRMRLLVLAVKAQRDSLQCEIETSAEADDMGVPTYNGDPPCWKGSEWDSDGQPTNPSDWCAPCLARQRWHLALRAVKVLHGVRLRRLQRWSVAPIASVPPPTAR